LLLGFLVSRCITWIMRSRITPRSSRRSNERSKQLVARRQRSADRQSLPGTRTIRDLSPRVTEVPDGASLPAVGCVRPNPRTIKHGPEGTYILENSC
jgi:hypothetical protein